jgi:hypothetical protein
MLGVAHLLQASGASDFVSRFASGLLALIMEKDGIWRR